MNHRYLILDPDRYHRELRRRRWLRAHLRAREGYVDALIAAIGLAPFWFHPLGQEVLRQLTS